MIIREFYMTRSDGVNLYKHYSDRNRYIALGDVLYEEAIDPENAGRVYIETDTEIERTPEMEEQEQLNAEEVLNILLGEEEVDL